MSLSPHAGLDALPVRLLLGGPHASAIRRWIESVTGWQPIEEATSAVPSALAILDVAAALGPAAEDRRTPVLLVVADDDPPSETAEAALRTAASGVLRWPADRDRLAEVAAPIVRRVERPGPPHAELRVAGAAGGVGTSTVAMGLGGLVAWSGRAVVVLTQDRLVGATDPETRIWDELTGVPLADAGTPVIGVPGLSVVRSSRPLDEASPDPSGLALVVRDLPPGSDADVLVTRRDRAGLMAVRQGAAAVVVVVDQGPVGWSALHTAAEGRRLVRAAWSQRVARAVLTGRVPAGLPGTWLRALRAVLEHRT